MATRSRRSGAGTDSLNPAMIQLYDTGRLRRELKQRGLDTTGNKSVLADRLQEAVLSERNSRQTYSPPPQPEKTTKKGSKRTLKGSEGNENEAGAGVEQSSPKEKKKRLTEEVDEINLIEESFSIELSTIAAIDEVQMEAERTFLPGTSVDKELAAMPQDELPPACEQSLPNAEVTPKKMEIVQPKPHSPEIKIRIKSKSPKKPKSYSSECKRQVVKREKVKEEKVIEDEQNASSSDEELRWLNKSRTEKRSRKALPDGGSFVKGGFEDEKESTGKETLLMKLASEDSELILKDVAEKAHERSSKSSSTESSKVEEKSLAQKGPIKIKFKTDVLKNVAKKHSKPKRKALSAVVTSTASEQQKEHAGSAVASTSQVTAVKDSMQEKAVRTDTPPLPVPNVEKAKEQAPRKKIPLRMQAPVDVLDSIFDKQAQLLSSKYKSEQERALERQKLEIAKRRQGAAPPVFTVSSPATVEKRRHTVDFVLPAKSYHEERTAQCSTSDHRLQHSRERATMDEKRMLAKLPPPPPPPPLLPCPNTSALPSSSSPALSSTSAGEKLVDTNIVGTPVESLSLSSVATSGTPGSNDSPSSAKTPPAAQYKSSSTTPIESVFSSEPTTSSAAPVTKMDSERIKEMASALQAVFARLSSVPPPPEPPQISTCLDESEEVGDETVASKFELLSKEAEVTLTGGGCAEVTTVIHEQSAVPATFTEHNVDEVLMQAADSMAAATCSEVVQSGCEEQIIAYVVDELIRSTADNELPTSDIESSNEDGLSHIEISEKEGIERKPDISEELLRDPRLLLQKASDVLKSLQSREIAAAGGQVSAEKQNQQYEQLPLDEEYEEDEEDKPLPEFHGEPVPDSDDEIIIEGVSRKRCTRKNMLQDEEPIPGDEQIEIDFYNADLNIKASESCQDVIDPDNGDGFALMWGGARSTYGIRVSCDVVGFPAVIFQIKVLECMPVKHLPFEEIDAHDVRVGWSTQNSTNILGEGPHSYAYGSLAKKSTNNVFTDYGDPFQVGDVITSCLDLASNRIFFWKNVEYMGVAFSDVSFGEDEVVFPHVCTKNCKLSVNYGDNRSDDWIQFAELQKDDTLDVDFAPIYFSRLDRKVLVRGLVPPSSKSECTVLMMVGLPGVGKTTWVRQYLREHPQEQWTLLSTDTILAAMKVNGVPRSRVHQGRWDMVMGLIAKALNRSLHLACRRRRNYIIDQTNVSKEARRRKLSQFKDFQRKCVVIIPSEEEMVARQMKQSRMDGAGPIPVEAMLELKAMLSIPNVETEPIEDVFFVEPPLERIGDAIDLVLRFNEEARPWCQKRRGRRGEPLRQNEPRPTNNTRVPSDSSAVSATKVGDGSQSNGQPSSAIIRSNEGCRGFRGVVPSSLTSSLASSWAERKSAPNN